MLFTVTSEQTLSLVHAIRVSRDFCVVFTIALAIGCGESAASGAAGGGGGPDSGTDANGGSAGTGGAAGSAGDAGSAGQATGGTGGTGGTGTGGTGGTSETGGTGGIGGASGAGAAGGEGGSGGSPPTANLLFASSFSPDVSLGAPRNLSAPPSGAGLAWQDLTGQDHDTDWTWPVEALGAIFSGVQLITYEPVTPSTIGDYVTAEIRQVAGPHGTPVYELFQNVKIKAPAGAVPAGKGAAQAPLLIQRPWTIGDVTDLYVTYWFKHQADLVTQLDSTVSSGNWRVQFEFKTGGYQNNWPGDYRITTHVMKGTDGQLYWYTKGDNVANGPWPRVDYWVEDNHTVPVPVDTWFRFEAYWHRSSGSDGRYWAAVDGQVIVDHHGPNMGDYDLPITRIFITNPYSGGHANDTGTSVQSHMTGLEIWDGFPCGVGTTCYPPDGAP